MVYSLYWVMPDFVHQQYDARGDHLDLDIEADMLADP